MKIHSIVSMFILAGCLITLPADAFGSGKKCQKHNGNQTECASAGCYYNNHDICVNKVKK